MSSGVSHMSGRTCAHHVNGRCIYDEYMNPGYDKKTGCKVLDGWEQAFDDFIDRAEAFRLEDEKALGMWENYMERLPAANTACPDFMAASAQPVSCVHRLGRLCLPAMPPCAGRCSKYVHFQTVKNPHRR